MPAESPINEVQSYLSIIVSLFAIGAVVTSVLFWRFATVFIQKKDADKRFDGIDKKNETVDRELNELKTDFARHKDHVGGLSEMIDLKLEHQSEMLKNEFKHLNNNIAQLVKNSDTALKISMNNQDEIDTLKKRIA